MRDGTETGSDVMADLAAIARAAASSADLESRGAHRILGSSKQWKDVLAQATKVAGTETTVLLTGESGTGKEVVARFIHRGSPRAQGPFTALNCASCRRSGRRWAGLRA